MKLLTCGYWERKPPVRDTKAQTGPAFSRARRQARGGELSEQREDSK